MSWIRTIHESEAEGRLSDVYESIRESRGKLSNIMRVQSLAPEAMSHHMDLYLEIMFRKGGLSRAEREMIAVVVSVANGCEYCTLHHGAALEAWWKDPDRVQALRTDPLQAGLSRRESALVGYALALTDRPAAMVPADLEPMRDEGLTDDEILQANLIVAYFNFVNRIALGLGVAYSDDEVAGYKV
jgi:uncharacterized peroxidase-related enzyme